MPLLFQDHGQHAAIEHKDQLSAELGSTKHCNSSSQAQAAASSPQTATSDRNVNKTVIPADLIKREQDAEECTSLPAKEDPDPPPLNKSTVHGPSKRRLSQSLKVDKASNWNSLSGTEDTRDELKLTAYDVIAGVISTPPIQPLEQDADITCTNKSPVSSAAKAGESHPTTHSITPTLSAATTASLITHTTTLTNKKKDQLSLVKDLDEFSKVMHQVTQEQRAKERRRRDSLASEMEYPASQSHPAHLLNQSSPYLAMGQPCPLPSHQNNKNYYQQQQKYTPLQAPPAQVDSAYQPKSVTKPQVILPGLSSSVRSEPSSSAANHVPGTPTTPLEHFSAFHSPPSHVPLASNQSPGAQGCPPPPPYSSTAMCYTYGQESIHQSAASSPVSERWSLPSHPQQVIQHSAVSDQPITMQENIKETILAHVSSRVVSLAGQKRALNTSVVPPPAKHSVSLLGRCPANSAAAACGHGGYSCPTKTPYPGGPPPSAPASVTFPHQSL